MQTKEYCIFLYSPRREATDKPSNVRAATKPFPSVYIIGIACFDESFLFYGITERHYFLTSLTLL